MVTESSNEDELKASLLSTVTAATCSHCGRGMVDLMRDGDRAQCPCGKTVWLSLNVILPSPVERIVLELKIANELTEEVLCGQ